MDYGNNGQNLLVLKFWTAMEICKSTYTGLSP